MRLSLYYFTTYKLPKMIKQFYTITERITGKVIFESATCESLIEAQQLAREHIKNLKRAKLKDNIKTLETFKK